MYHRTLPGLLRDLTAQAARRMLPEQDRTNQTASPNLFTELSDNDALAAMLRKLGYEVEVQRYASGEATCLISRHTGDGRHTIEVELSPGTSRIWLAARIGSADLHQAAAPLLARLLGENVRIAPHFFGYRAGDQRLLLQTSLDNRDMTPARLESCLERLCKRIRETRSSWAALVRTSEGASADRAEWKPIDADQRTWCAFTSGEGRFRVRLPEAPRIETQALLTEKGLIDLHIIFADDRDEAISYGVCYSDLDAPTLPDGEHSVEAVLARAREAVAELLNGEVLEERPIELEGHPGRELMVRSRDRDAAVARVYCVRGRIFQVLAIGENVDPCQPPVRDFLESFRLMSE
jgi:hypothetical protein